MTHIRNISTHDEFHGICQNFDTLHETLVVADLNTKLHIQKDLMEKHSFLEKDAVLRVNELWIKILFKIQPDMRVVSPTLARSLIMKWLEEADIPWARTTRAASSVFQYIQQLLPLLCRESHNDVLKSWLENHPNAIIRWGHWFQLALDCWTYFDSLKLIPNPWVRAYLASIYEGHLVWEKKLIVNLGYHLSPVESDILSQMQKKHDIEVLKPAPQWAEDTKESLLGYSLLAPKTKTTPPQPSMGDTTTNACANTNACEPSLITNPPENLWTRRPPSFRRFSTMVSEVKDTTATVRQWLDTGAQPHEIAVLAPNIEVYWTVLRLYFQQEGIEVEKPLVIPLISRLDISRWLSSLRLRSGKVSYEDIEITGFTPPLPPLEEGFEFIRRIFKNIYGPEDLKRFPRIAQKLSNSLQEDHTLQGDHTPQKDGSTQRNKLLPKNKRLQRDEFFALAFPLWKGGETSAFQLLCEFLFADAPPHLSLKLSQWIAYVEELCARIEMKEKTPTGDGIPFNNIESGIHSKCKYVYMMGVSESELKPRGGTTIDFKDVLEIHRDTGYVIDFVDPKKQEFEIRWLLESPLKDIVVSVSSSNFLGAVEGPARLWLQGAMTQSYAPKNPNAPSDPKTLQPPNDLEALSSPAPSRWDEIQLNALGDSHSLEKTQGRIKLDQRPSLSVTTLQNYAQCPFIFAARKLFCLQNLPNIDMDLDALTQGQVMHDIFKKLTQPPFRENYTNPELMQIIQSCVNNQKNHTSGSLWDPRIWDFFKPGLLKMARQFITSEIKLRKSFPKMRTEGREIPLKADWNLKKGDITAPGSGDYEFKGSIDRVDTNRGSDTGACRTETATRNPMAKTPVTEVSVVDYKLSLGGLTNFKSWAKNDSFQLSIYARALQGGWTELGPQEVLSAFYYVGRNMSREKGFATKDRGGDLFEATEAHCYDNWSVIQKHQDKVMSKIQEIIQRIEDGDFRPLPKDAKSCRECHWRKMCRAPHLN